MTSQEGAPKPDMERVFARQLLPRAVGLFISSFARKERLADLSAPTVIREKEEEIFEKGRRYIGFLAVKTGDEPDVAVTAIIAIMLGDIKEERVDPELAEMKPQLEKLARKLNDPENPLTFDGYEKPEEVRFKEEVASLISPPKFPKRPERKRRGRRGHFGPSGDLFPA